MYRSILIPLDGSQFAESALKTGLEIARRSNASIQLVQVHVPFEIQSSEIPVAYETLDAEARTQEQDYLNATREQIKSKIDLPVSAELLFGSVADTLGRHAAETDADLVVMATHGRGGVARLWLGSVADRLIRHTQTPVLLVHPDETTDLSSPVHFGRVLVPLDGSKMAEAIIEEAAVKIGRVMNSDFTLVRVVETVVDGNDIPSPHAVGLYKEYERLLQEEILEAETYLEKAAKNLEAHGLKVWTKTIIGQNIAFEIMEYVKRHGIDLIAMQTHGRHGLKRFLMGSVADKILRSASVPLLLNTNHE